MESFNDDNVFGSEDAQIILIEYGDYECPSCGAAHPSLREFLKEYKSRVKFVFRHFPFHEHSMQAARAAEAAGSQGKYWKMHDTLFENQKDLTDKALLRYAEGIGLDMKQFYEDISSDKFDEKIQRDLSLGQKQGIEGTPGFVLGDKVFYGSRSVEEWKEMIVNGSMKSSVQKNKF